MNEENTPLLKKGGSKNKNKDLNKDILYLPDILIKIIVLYTHRNNIQLYLIYDITLLFLYTY